MFLQSSRYFNVKTVTTESEAGREVQAVKLRRLPFVPGTPTVVKGNDRLDVMAQRNYNDATLFWHIADANTELEANELIKQDEQTHQERVIIVPEK